MHLLSSEEARKVLALAWCFLRPGDTGETPPLAPDDAWLVALVIFRAVILSGHATWDGESVATLEVP